MSFYQKDCVNYFFSSAVRPKTEVEQAKCHFRKSYKSDKDSCNKPTKQADRPPHGQWKKKKKKKGEAKCSPGGCRVAYSCSHSTAMELYPTRFLKFPNMTLVFLQKIIQNDICFG